MDTSPQVVNPLFANEILQLLPADEMRRLRPYLTRIRLVNGAVLHQAGERIEHILFVEQGFISMVATTNGPDGRVEVGLTGRESIVGSLALLVPGATSYVQAMVQMNGAAYRIPAAAVLAILEHLPALRRLMLHAFEASLAQIAQTAACNSRHTVPERLTRWLLMAHDRVDGNELALTQEFLAIMLAVRRPGVTIAIGELQATGLVQHSRGRILICDRPGLEAATCACYALVQKFVRALTSREI